MRVRCAKGEPRRRPPWLSTAHAPATSGKRGADGQGNRDSATIQARTQIQIQIQRSAACGLVPRLCAIASCSHLPRDHAATPGAPPQAHLPIPQTSLHDPRPVLRGAVDREQRCG